MASGFSFGAKTTAAPTFGFGTPASQAQASFGAPTNAVAPTLFATPAATPTTTVSLFGSSTPSTGLFGAAASSAAPTLNFGAPAVSLTTATVSSASGGLTFGAATVTSSAAPTFGLGTTQSAPSLAVAPASTSAAPSFGFGLGGGLTVPSLGAAVTTTNSSLTFGLGTTTLATSIPSTTTAPKVGLGGIATSTQSKSTAITTQKEVPPKEQPLPNEILQTVEQFKEMVKQQKSFSSDISRCSIREFRQVEQEIDLLGGQLNEVEKQLKKNRQMAEKLKYDTAKCVQQVEMAQRTHDTPPGLQYENTAPLKFFFNLSEQFENEMQNLKLHIETMEKYVKGYKNSNPLTPQDLSMGMRRLHETFVALAGRLQSVHTQVESEKETYLGLRKHLLQDTTNPFEKLTKAAPFHISTTFVHSPPKVASGPTPFNSYTLNASLTAPQAPSAQPPPYPGPSNNTGSGFGAVGFGNTSVGAPPSNASTFGNIGNNTFGQSSFSGSFQLQKPPTGSKRGKM